MAGDRAARFSGLPFRRAIDPDTGLLVLPERGASKLPVVSVLRFVLVYQGEWRMFRKNLALHFGVSGRTVDRYLPNLERADLLEGKPLPCSSHVRTYQLTPLAHSYLEKWPERLESYLERKLRQPRDG